MLRGKRLFSKIFRETRGNAAVEFALTFPTLVVITLMIFDLGRALFVYTTVNNVAADGARYAAVRGTGSAYAKTAAQIEDYIESVAAGLEPGNLTISVTYDPSNLPGAEVQVQVDYALEFFLSGVFETITGDIDASLTLTGISTMTVL